MLDFILIQRHPRQSGAFVGCLAAMLGLICSKFLLTCAMLLLLAVALISPQWREDWARFRAQPLYWGSIGIFVLFLGSVLLSNNQASAWVRLRIALPMLALPVAFGLLPTFSKRAFQALLLSYCYGMALAGIGVLIHYSMHYDAMQELLRVSKAIPTPNGQHIRFSLMLDLAMLWALWLWGNKRSELLLSIHRWLLPLIALFIFGLQHILSVRTGLVIAYIGVAIWLVVWLWRQKWYGVLVLGLVGLLVLPFVTYRYVPSVTTKFQLTRYNWELYERGEIGTYSDTRRLLSYQIGWEVAQQSPWIGVGIGDLNDEQAAIYASRYPEQPVMYPHNMFLTVYAGMGILGLLGFLFFFYVPLFYHHQYHHLGWLLFYVVMTLSFLTENTLFTSLGVGIYSLFHGLLLQQIILAPSQK